MAKAQIWTHVISNLLCQATVHNTASHLYIAPVIVEIWGGDIKYVGAIINPATKSRMWHVPYSKLNDIKRL